MTLVSLVSCLEELEDTDKIKSSTFKPAIEFPLVNSDFSMGEFITNGDSKAKVTEQSGIMVLTYDDSLSSPEGELFFTLPDQNSPTLSITGSEVSFPSSGATVTITKSLTFAFNTSKSEALDSILLKAGRMLFQINSNFPANINMAVSIASLQLPTGGSFQQSFVLNGPATLSPIINLQNSVFDLTANGTTSNTVTFSITALITDTGQSLDNTHSLDFSFDLDRLQFRGLFGDLGSHPFQFQADSIDMDVFDHALTGDIEFLSPAMTLTMRNSFGVPIGLTIQRVTAISEGADVTLSGPVVNSPVNPYRINGTSSMQIGQSVSSEIKISSANSNLVQVLSSLPNYLSYQLLMMLNPPPAVSKNFVLDDSRLALGIHLELPFHGRVRELSLSKRFDFEGLGIDDVAESSIKLKTINELPLDAKVQVYFVDNSGTVLDSLFTNPSILKGAAVDANGFTNTPAEVVSQTPITQAKVNRIEQAEFLVITAVMHTTNNGAVPVKFAATDKLKITLGVNTRVEYKLN